MLISREALLAELKRRQEAGQDCFGLELERTDPRWATGERFDVKPGTARDTARRLGLSPIEWTEQLSTAVGPQSVTWATDGYGERLKEARRRRSLTLDALAAQVGLSTSYLSDVERGRRGPLAPRATMQLEAALGVADNGLLDARARYLERSTLPLGLRPDQDAAALHLGRVWASLGPEAVKRVLEAVKP